MELREIKYILSIYRNGSITKAAVELYITQPALSKFLKNLERQLGAPLFSRMGNHLVPTHFGTRYLSYAATIETLQSDCRMECADLLEEQEGQLTIAVSFLRGACILPSLLSRFYAKYPRVKVNLMEEARLLEDHMLSARDVHFVIGNEKYSKSLLYEEVGREEVVLVLAQNHALAQQVAARTDCRYPWLDLRLIGNTPLILHPTEQTTGAISRNLLKTAGMTPNVLMETRNAGLAVRMAAQGLALAFTPESYVRQFHFDVPPLCCSVGQPKTETTLYIAYQKGRYLPSYAEYFIELLRSEMGNREVPLHNQKIWA